MNKPIEKAYLLFLALAAQQQGMRGGLERLGANRDALAQMQALSQNLKQHRSAHALPAQDQAQPTPAELATKGPRLPLRPKPQQQKQRSASTGPVQDASSVSLPCDTGSSLPKQFADLHSHAFAGQENSFHPLQSTMPDSMQGATQLPHPSEPVTTASQANLVHNWQLHQDQEAAGGLGDVEMQSSGGNFNALAHPGQLAAGMQESLLGQHRTASGAAEQDMQLPLSYTASAGPAHLGDCSACLTAAPLLSQC